MSQAECTAGFLPPSHCSVHNNNLRPHPAIIARLVAQLIVNKEGLEGIKDLNRTHAANGT